MAASKLGRSARTNGLANVSIETKEKEKPICSHLAMTYTWPTLCN